MANQTRILIIEELNRAIQEKERELSELDLMLADYFTEHFNLIRELRRLRALRDKQEAASSISNPSLDASPG
jgi:hypothetical protein